MALRGDNTTEYADKTEQIEVFFKTKLGFDEVANKTEEDKLARDLKFKTLDQHIKRA